VTAVLRADSVGKSFGRRTVLTSAYCQAAAGTVTALVGRNGAGKSTLLKILAGWLAPDHGFVEFCGRRYLRPRASRLALAGLFYLPVDRSILSPPFTLGQHLDAMEKRFGSRDPGERRAVLEQLGIAGLEASSTASLSGGERRRAELAIALLRRPVCLLADEPFLGLEPNVAEIVADALKLLAGQGTAVLFTGHEMTWTAECADQMVWVREGTTQLLGSASEAMRHWQFRRDYLGLAVR
jgi:ABC-type multidrug transport system ATPase subunit